MADFEALVDAGHTADATRLVDGVVPLFAETALKIGRNPISKAKAARLHTARFLERVLRATMAVPPACVGARALNEAPAPLTDRNQPYQGRARSLKASRRRPLPVGLVASACWTATMPMLASRILCLVPFSQPARI